jgi:hypothetical protein
VIEEFLTDDERQLLMVFVMEAMVRISSDPAMRAHVGECDSIFRKLQGVDTVVICRKAGTGGNEGKI